MSEQSLTDLSAYDYALPPAQIAQFPMSPRDHSRLMIIHRSTGLIEHRHFYDLSEYLDEKDLLVANNTKVMKARIAGNRLLSRGNAETGEVRKVGGKIEMLMLERREDLEKIEGFPTFIWEGAFHSAARQLPGFQFTIPKPDGSSLEGEIIRGAKESLSGTVIVRFSEDPLLAGVGELPLPHYIERTAGASQPETDQTKSDEIAYQTVYAKHLGSAAAPTAGLHFTSGSLAEIEKRGASWAEVTLHVGLGTFRPVKSEDIRFHVMHEERYSVTPEVAAKLADHRRSGGRILGVGTTSVRTLESVYESKTGEYRSGSDGTTIFIYPGGRKIEGVDRLLTNFHLPKSTLLMLVSAFAGRDLVLRAYREAVEKGYRFFSYGDAMLILE